MSDILDLKKPWRVITSPSGYWTDECHTRISVSIPNSRPALLRR